MQEVVQRELAQALAGGDSQILLKIWNFVGFIQKNCKIRKEKSRPSVWAQERPQES